MSTAPVVASRSRLDDLLSGLPEQPATQAAWLVERAAWLTDDTRDNLMASAPSRLHLLVGEAMLAAQTSGSGREAAILAEAAHEQVRDNHPDWSPAARAWLAQVVTGAALSLLIDGGHDVADTPDELATPWRAEVGDLDPVTLTHPAPAGSSGRHLYAVKDDPAPEADAAEPEAGQQALDLDVIPQKSKNKKKTAKKPKSPHPTWFTPVWPDGLTRPEARYTEIDAGLDSHVTVEQVIDGISLGMGILANAKVHRWADLDAVLPEHVRVTDEQLDLLHAVEPLLMLVGVTVRKDGVTEKGIKLVVCPDCGRWLLLSGGATPKRCTMTIDCGGTPVAIKPATAANQPAFDKLPQSMSRDMAGSF